MLLAKVASRLQKFPGTGVHSALALDGFNDNGANLVMELGLQVFHLIALHKLKPRNQGSEGDPVSIVVGGGEASISPSVEGIVQRQNLVLAFTQPVLVGIAPGQLEGGFHGFGAAVAEECPLHSRDLQQLPGQQGLIGMVEEVGDVDGLLELFAHHGVDAGMIVAQGTDGDAGEQIEVALALKVIEHALAAFLHKEGILLVVAEQDLGLECLDLFQIHQKVLRTVFWGALNIGRGGLWN